MILVKAGVLLQNNYRTIGKEHQVSAGRLTYASMVQQYAPELVEEVVNGMLSLDAAYRTAQDRKREAEEQVRRNERLEQHSADLADRIRDGEISQRETYSIYEERCREEERAAQERDDRVKRFSTGLAQAVQTFLAVTLDPVPGGESVYSLFEQRKAGVNQLVNKETLKPLDGSVW